MQVSLRDKIRKKVILTLTNMLINFKNNKTTKINHYSKHNIVTIINDYRRIMEILSGSVDPKHLSNLL